MSGRPDPDLPVSRRLLGVLGAWLQASRAYAAPGSAPAAADGVRHGAAAPGSVRVLVVDDDPVNLTLASAQLGRLGLVPLLAADGAEAVAFAGQLAFDLILMDVQMPVLNGLEASREIRRVEAREGQAPVPIVAYSSTALAMDLLTAHGLSGRLDKPCDLQALQNCLVQWCPGYRPAADELPAAGGTTFWRTDITGATTGGGTGHRPTGVPGR